MTYLCAQNANLCLQNANKMLICAPKTVSSNYSLMHTNCKFVSTKSYPIANLWLKNITFYIQNT